MGDLDHEEFRRSSAPDCLDPKELETGFVGVRGGPGHLRSWAGDSKM